MPHSAGDVIGDRYRLIAKIGEGGMATVWEAEHVALGSLVAVKFLHRTAPQDSELAQRFLREARVAASVKHRNVVEINDFGFTAKQVPYMVMERLVGESLADFLHHRGPLPFHEAARIASLTLRGLSAVHSAGIVHRDLKPDNVFLVHDEDGVFPKLLDFGLSRRIGRTDMTLEGTLMGTPDYMSPEQARGQTDLDARTDIYSMGVILYEMVSARMPYESELIGDLIAMISRDPPTPVTRYRADAPAELVGVIERAMAKRRDERFPDARAMRSALGQVWSGLAKSSTEHSDLASVSEFPHPAFEDTGTDLLRQHEGDARPFVSARASLTNASQPSTVDATVAERVGFVDAPTMLAAPIDSSPRTHPHPQGRPSVWTSLFALSLAAAAGATFAVVWVVNGDGGQDSFSFGGTSTMTAEPLDAGTDAHLPESPRPAAIASPADPGEASSVTATRSSDEITEQTTEETAETTVEAPRTAARPARAVRATQAERASKRRPAKRARETSRRGNTKRRPSTHRR